MIIIIMMMIMIKIIPMAKIFSLIRSTESTVAAIQEQVISTKYIKNHLFSFQDDDDTC